jgi:hypothetical protein
VCAGPRSPGRWLSRWRACGHVGAAETGEDGGDDFVAQRLLAALDRALCLATGKPWRGREVKQERVLFIAGEGA